MNEYKGVSVLGYRKSRGVGEIWKEGKWIKTIPDNIGIGGNVKGMRGSDKMT